MPLSPRSALPPCPAAPVIANALPLPGGRRGALPPLPVSLPGDTPLSVAGTPRSVPAAAVGVGPVQPNILPKGAKRKASAAPLPRRRRRLPFR
jgi:hypothetical protein